MISIARNVNRTSESVTTSKQTKNRLKPTIFYQLTGRFECQRLDLQRQISASLQSTSAGHQIGLNLKLLDGNDRQ